MDTVIDIDKLCAPFSDDNPCGEDPREDERFDSAYQQLKTLREEAMSGERVNRSAMDEGESTDSYAQLTAWKAVVEQASSIIEEESKDLEVAALLMEGLVRTDGVAGLRDGMLLATRLVKEFWDKLNPPLDPNDEDSLEDRIAAFNGLDGANQPGTVARYIPRLPVTGAGYDDFMSYELSSSLAGSSSEDADAGAAIAEAARNTPMTFYVDLVADIESCEEALGEMDVAFTEVCGYDGPSVSRIREALGTYASNVRYIGKDQLELAAAKAEEGEEVDGEEAAVSAEGGGGAAAPGGGSGPVQNRSDALKRLRIVADFFRRTEPHSPLSYSLENLLRWADMPLDKLIEEWIPDSTAREHFQLMTGLTRHSGEESSDDSW